jgi:mannose/cellobiose epimerase-like protein (N-acyl-D-glucosamine 2-epimerase family)
MRRALICLIAIATLVPAQTPPPVPATKEELLQRLHRGEWWLSHAIGDLMPFWIHPDALGKPIGAFPTTRCDDGTLPTYEKNLCPEIRNNNWLFSDRQRYLVALSRQIYGYGVLFHLTGDAAFMDYMKAGVKYLRENAYDRKGGGIAQTQNATTGVWGPQREFRDPQQLAYGLLGISFYYYLTRDPEVLPDILDVKNYIFDNYYNPKLTALNWMLADNGNARADQRKLTAQLDQMNAYLIMLAPALPADQQEDLKWACVSLSYIMIGQLYSPKENVFFLQVDKPSDLDLEQTGVTDFGHSIKAMWMIRNTGLMAGDQSLVEFAETNGRRILDRAYLADNGTWASAPKKGGKVDINKSWWIYAELDQFAGSLAMTDPMAARYLPNTHNYFLTYFPDKRYGEIWTTIDGNTNLPLNDQPKAWPWKNAYHSLEHAMVGYITSQQIFGEPVTLYYNFKSKPEDGTIRPYYYSARIESLTSTPDERGSEIQKVVFRDVR